MSPATVGAALLAALFGCSGLPQEVLEEANQSSKDYLLGPEDVLEVVVWRNQDLSREVVVRPDGMISLPLIGEVEAAGINADQLADRIKKRLKEFVDSPTVSVSVTGVNSYSIYVLGEVPKPGKFQLKSYATVLQAIALAGGFTPFARRNGIQVIRNTSNGHGIPREMRIPVRYDDLLFGGEGISNFFLKSGDVIVVP